MSIEWAPGRHDGGRDITRTPGPGGTPLQPAERGIDEALAVELELRRSVSAVPVVTARGELVSEVLGIVSRRDPVRAIARDDEAVRDDVQRRLRKYNEDVWDVTVDAGVVRIDLATADPWCDRPRSSWRAGFRAPCACTW